MFSVCGNADYWLCEIAFLYNHLVFLPIQQAIYSVYICSRLWWIWIRAYICVTYNYICTSVAEKTRLDTGVGLLLYKKICSQIASPPQSSIVNGLPGSEVKIPGREMGAS